MTVEKSFVEPACGERDIVVTLSVRCMCVHCAVCVRPSGFVMAITSTFMHGFQNCTVVLLDELKCHLKQLIR